MLFLLADILGRGALRVEKGRHLLEVVLHIGAHRTGTTALQRRLSEQRATLRRQGIALWTPEITRSHLFDGLTDGPEVAPDTHMRRLHRSSAIIAIEIERLAADGFDLLLVSEENILGSIRRNLRMRALYPDLSERLARFSRVFGPSCRRIGLCIRPYEDYWSSALSYSIRAGGEVPDAGCLEQLARQPRSWRDVVKDIVHAFPESEIVIWEFDRLIGRPNAQFRLLTGGRGRIPRGAGRKAERRINAAPDRAALRELLIGRGDGAGAARLTPGKGRYRPFAANLGQLMNARYQADIDWLRSVMQDAAISPHPAMAGTWRADFQELRGTA